jgi:hypothetical protein
VASPSRARTQAEALSDLAPIGLRPLALCRKEDLRFSEINRQGHLSEIGYDNPFLIVNSPTFSDMSDLMRLLSGMTVNTKLRHSTELLKSRRAPRKMRP